jgi:hypothetical protein
MSHFFCINSISFMSALVSNLSQTNRLTCEKPPVDVISTGDRKQKIKLHGYFLPSETMAFITALCFYSCAALMNN